jgi:hypothetical protein
MRLGSPGPSSLRRRWKGKEREKETEKEKENEKERERRRDGLARRAVEGTGGVDGLVLPLDMVGTGVYDV